MFSRASLQSPCRNSVYVFVRNGLTWTEQAKLQADDPILGDYFGGINGSIAISGDTVIVGYSNERNIWSIQIDMVPMSLFGAVERGHCRRRSPVVRRLYYVAVAIDKNTAVLDIPAEIPVGW